MTNLPLVSLTEDAKSHSLSFFGVWNEVNEGKDILYRLHSVTSTGEYRDFGTQINQSAGVRRSYILFQPRSIINAVEWMAVMPKIQLICSNLRSRPLHATS